MSPTKKKAKFSSSPKSNKRAIELPESPRKRSKLSKEEEMKAKRKKNFIAACELVSSRSYFNHRERLLLVYLPACAKTICDHHTKSGANIHQMPTYADEAFMTEMKNNLWYEALEVCHMCITPTQYLSTDTLKDVVEIMMNAQEDEYSEHEVQNIVDMCQQILMQNFSTHPPCIDKNLRNSYKNFLTSPMDIKENTFTDRSQYECNKGIVKYCVNRLEYELSAESVDGPLINKDINIPEEMKLSVRGLHWQKQKFEIFELLHRPDRIDRLFAVLETIIELLQFDLVIWHSRYINDLGRHIMRSHKPLMAYVLWSDNVLYTGAVTNNCRQILRIFAQMIHLQYPDSKIKIISMWLNTMIQTFYICETNSNMDYPNTSKYCTMFAKDFYRMISDMPHESIIRILERIKPSFMTHLVGMLHIQNILPTKEDCIIRILIDFVKQAQWQSYPSNSEEIQLSNKLFLSPKKVKKKICYLLKKCTNPPLIDNTQNKPYGKSEPKIRKNKDKPLLNHVVKSMYVTIKAYLDAYDVQSVQETWCNLDNQVMNEDMPMEDGNVLSGNSCYSVSESLVKKYRNIMQLYKELHTIFRDLKSSGQLPEVLDIFGNIGLTDV